MCRKTNKGGKLIIHVKVKFVTVFQVSRLLQDLLGDVCEPFYYGTLGLDPRMGTRRSLKVSEYKTIYIGTC